ncbi:hypothetical protein [Geminisphaera colitermitum]|uniref:hypothetical protein n=1 Tax=Geminisphaera colitermitum TaxID=1148786 RepID=UPI000158CF00|nr:hypothetical protein [Geminisphaera colitermitum]
MKTSLIKTSILAGLFCLINVTLHAINFTFNAALSSGLASSDGIDLPTGMLLRFGVFDLADEQITANASNLAYLDAHFQEINRADIGDGNPVGGASPDDPINAGLFSSALRDIDTTPVGQNIAGQRLFYWVFNSTTFSTATEHGIFSSTDWLIPSGTGDPFDFGVVYTDIADLTTNQTGQALAASARVIIGAFGPGVNPQGGGINFTLSPIAPIPEPATCIALFATIALALAIRERRKII